MLAEEGTLATEDLDLANSQRLGLQAAGQPDRQ
jgi:hypothetical protein